MCTFRAALLFSVMWEMFNRDRKKKRSLNKFSEQKRQDLNILSPSCEFRTAVRERLVHIFGRFSETVSSCVTECLGHARTPDPC